MVRSADFLTKWQEILVGQNHATEAIVPYVKKFIANLHRKNSTIGNFYLNGPTGCGKTRCPETLAKILHGDEKKLLMVRCETYQRDHEVAKLIGCPPGYLGHRETVPLLAQVNLDAVTSENCKMSIIVFDEIEKASDALWKILLGVLDAATLQLGDNTTVNFENAILFFTSNLHANKLTRQYLNESDFGFKQKNNFDDKKIRSEQMSSALDKIGKKSVEQEFSAEFFNRIDETIIFHPLTQTQLVDITKIELSKINEHIENRLKEDAFDLQCNQKVLEHIAKIGTNHKYGARFLKRTIDKEIYNPICEAYLNNEILPNSVVEIIVLHDKLKFKMTPVSGFHMTSKAS